ncbi:MAG: hypothetical protein WCH46_03985 [bacterium]
MNNRVLFFSAVCIVLFSNVAVAQELPTYHPPLLGKIPTGEILVRQESKFLFSDRRYIFNVHLFYTESATPQGYDYLIRTEGINNKGIHFYNGIGDSNYWIDPQKQTFEREKRRENKLEWEDFFSAWLLRPKEKQKIEATSPIRDTVVEGVA